MSAQTLSAVEIHALHQQAKGIMSGILNLARDIASTPEFSADDSMMRGLDQLQLDLSKLKVALDKLNSFNRSRMSMNSLEHSLPSLLGGMALGVALGKLLGSKFQWDLLPFLVGLDLVTGKVHPTSEA